MNKSFSSFILVFLVGLGKVSSDDVIEETSPNYICSKDYHTLNASLAMEEERPCFILLKNGAAAYHNVVCMKPSLLDLRASLADYKQLHCRQSIALQITQFDHPFDEHIFTGLEDRLLMLVIQQWDPTMPSGNESDSEKVTYKLRGSPFIRLKNLEVLDVGLTHVADSQYLTGAFFEGPRSLRILQTGNVASRLLLDLNLPNLFPGLQCAGFHKSVDRNCTCQDAEELAMLKTWKIRQTNTGMLNFLRHTV